MFWTIPLIALSFYGLCECVRAVLDDEGPGFQIPLVTACGIITVLMVAGMLRLLFPAWVMLVALGGAAFVWFPLIRRRRVHWPVLAVVGGAALFAVYRFRGSYFALNDTVAHWGLAAKYLILKDRFPDAAADVIYYPSYPLGTAVYQYFFLRPVGADASAMLIMNLLLSVFALMPMMSAIQRNRLPCALIAAGTIVVTSLIIPYRFRSTLIVDALVGQMALGGSCMI